MPVPSLAGDTEGVHNEPSTQKKPFLIYGMVAVVIVLAGIGVWCVWYLRATERQKATENYHLGLAYQYGQGVPRDDAQAVSWFRKAAEHGNADAQSQLGWAYENGYGGLAKNDSEAVRWYRKAAEKGSSLGQYNLGGAFYYGRGVQLDYTQAVNWYRKSADQGYMSAQHNLAGMFAEGKGVAKDDVEAVRWLRKAADQGDAESQFNLGIMYEYGRGGLANDNAQALSWFQKAADQGYALAKDAPSRMQQEQQEQARTEALKQQEQEGIAALMGTPIDFAALYAKAYGTGMEFDKRFQVRARVNSDLTGLFQIYPQGGNGIFGDHDFDDPSQMVQVMRAAVAKPYELTCTVVVSMGSNARIQIHRTENCN